MQNIIILVSLLCAIAIIIFNVRALRKTYKFDFNSNLRGAATWSFTDSWASTFTGISAVFGSFLALGLEFDVLGLNQDTFGLLNFLFAVIVLVAALVYKATGKDVREGDKEFFMGKLWAFLLAALLTLWAVFGQIVGFITTLYGLLTPKIATVEELVLFILLMLMVIVLLFIHTSRSLDSILSTQLMPEVSTPVSQLTQGEKIPKESFNLL